MRLIKPASGVVFAEDKTEEAFNSLADGDSLKKVIKKTIEKLNENVFYGEKISKKQIPKEYVHKYGIDNLYWCQLPNAWRLVYSVEADSVEILAVIIEYFNHKNYERRFNY